MDSLVRNSDRLDRLTPKQQQEFVACYEAFYWQQGRIPAVAELNRAWGTDFTQGQYEKALKHESLQKYFQERAIPNPYIEQPTLSPKQMDFLRILLDPTDTRSLHHKLKAVKATQAEHAAWLRDPNYAALVRDETSKLFEDSRSRVFMALSREASAGNVPAMKLYLEMTGDYTPANKSGTTINVHQDLRFTVQKVLEVLQKHVSTQVLLNVAEELEQVLFPQLPSNRPTVKQRQVLTVPEVTAAVDEEDPF